MAFGDDNDYSGDDWKGDAEGRSESAAAQTNGVVQANINFASSENVRQRRFQLRLSFMYNTRVLLATLACCYAAIRVATIIGDKFGK